MNISNDLFQLKDTIETPHLIYSEAILEKAVISIKESLNNSLNKNAVIFYAVKSCYNQMALQTISSLGIGAEVMSELEYNLAISNNFHPQNILVNGLGRSYNFLEKSSLDGATIIIDSPTDLEKVGDISKRNANKQIKVGIRISIDLLDFSTSPYKDKENKLGIDPSSVLFNDFIELCRTQKNVKLEIVHCHTTINQENANIYEYVLEKMKPIVKRIEEGSLQIVPTINIGGGFKTYSYDELNDQMPLFKSIAEAFNKTYTDKTLAVEPGRFLSNSCGFVIGEVLDIKQKFSIHHIITDASTNTLIPIPTARYKLIYPKTRKRDGISVSITDGITSPDNMVVSHCKIKNLPEIGSKIILGNCGAYTDTLGEFWVFLPFKTSFLKKDNQLINTRSMDDITNAKKLYWQ